MTATENVTTKKPTFKLVVEYQKADGSWTSQEGERSFDVPEELAKIDVSYIKEDGTSATETRNFKRKLVRSREDILALLQDEQETQALIMAYLYGMDLFYRSIIKAPIANEVEGPGKVILKLAEQLVKSYRKLGMTISEEEAFKMAQENLSRKK